MVVSQPSKSVGFYLAFLSLSLYAFTHALETTIFPISLPVGKVWTTLAVIFSLSVIYYGIAIVKNTAPRSPQPHSTSMICPILIPHNDAPLLLETLA
ncbi:hypothetical protein ACN38_g5588 [Penicillium nordicum]|uniref:Uncharacterized protein n=1 Tax=Penicillium nordicum TaxID=229535 RepID=A0A0M8P4S9_9EURO|nr:hypothetical protein ACN38_g5588 [Penicillium nordicum]